MLDPSLSMCLVTLHLFSVGPLPSVLHISVFSIPGQSRQRADIVCALRSGHIGEREQYGSLALAHTTPSSRVEDV